MWSEVNNSRVSEGESGSRRKEEGARRIAAAAGREREGEISFAPVTTDHKKTQRGGKRR